ncbi:Slp family lipoprotein [Thiohalospira sp.]|uniref:Slp family lipoprotein n=1 Tax=Thiohalospira sp. TaxID=3080549 RepID=UPI003980BDDF
MVRSLVRPLLSPSLAPSPLPLLVALLAGLLAGCATPPFETGEAQRDPAPSDVTEEEVGESFLWGGLILGNDNREDGSTVLEVLALPLDGAGRPRKDEGEPRGRFLAVSGEFRDPAEYRTGRQLLVLGRLTGFEEGRIGEATYHYPQLDAEALHLWGNDGRSPGSSWHFGIGLGIGL